MNSFVRLRVLAAVGIFALCSPLAFGQEMEAEPEATGAPPAPSELKVVTYNIRAGLGLNRAEDVTPTDHLEMLSDYLIKLDADIYLLQEVDRNVRRSERRDQPAIFAEALGDFHAHYTKAIDLQGGEFGVAILSRWPIVDARDVLLYKPDYLDQRDVPEWYSEQRVFQIALIDSPFGAIPVGNTHLGLTEEQRVNQINEMVETIEEISVELPWIVGGDLNAEQDAPEQKPLRALLRDVYEGREGSTLAETIPVDQRYTFRSDNPSACIDFILVSDAHWDVKSTDVIRSNMSDHLPVITVLTPR